MNQFINFKLNDQCFGLDVADVKDVAPYEKLHSVALASDEILGNMNIRGSIILVLDIRKLIGLEARGKNEQGKVIVVEYKNELLGLYVDEVGDFISTSLDDIANTSDKLEVKIKSFAVGVLAANAHNNGDLVIMLDLDKLISKFF